MITVKNKMIGIDAGSTSSGIIVLVEGKIREGYNMTNEEVIPFIEREQEGYKLTVVIEDVRPYNMRITNGIIDTIKFIGQIEWRLKSIDCKIELVPRWQVKQWVYIQFKTIVTPLIQKKIDYSHERKKKLYEDKGWGEKKKSVGSFVWVDDRIIIEAMRKHWNIPKTKKVGQLTMYNLREHSWQALALCSYFLKTK